MRIVNKMLQFGSALSVFFIGGMAAVFGEEAVAQAASSADNSSVLQWLGLGGALALGIAAAGVGTGQGRAVGAAMEGISRNPQAQKEMFVPLILGLAFMEALVIFTLIFVVVFKQTLL